MQSIKIYLDGCTRTPGSQRAPLQRIRFHVWIERVPEELLVGRQIDAVLNELVWGHVDLIPWYQTKGYYNANMPSRTLNTP